MMLAIGVLLVLAAIAFVLLPLFQRAPLTVAVEADPLERRAALYQEILDAELDFRLGKLSEADFLEMRDRLLAEAVILLRADPETDTMAARQQIEAEIEAARAALGGRALVDRAGA